MTSDHQRPSAPALEFVTCIHVDVAAPLALGEDSRGRRRFIPITGGYFSGPGLNGRVLAGGGDWQTLRADGVAELEARYFLQTDAGDLIEVTNTGYRHAPEEIMARLIKGEAVPDGTYYFQTTPRLHTTSADLDWLNRTIFIGAAQRLPDDVIIDVFAVTGAS